MGRIRLAAFTAQIVCAAGMFFVAVAYALLTQRLPPISDFDRYFLNQQKPTIILDRSGTHELMKLSSPVIQAQRLGIGEAGVPGFSQNLINSVVASRQPNFWDDDAFKPFALLQKIVGAKPPTIAEELVNQVYQRQLGKGAQQRLLSAILAAQVTSAYGKRQILTWYLNNAYFGQLAFGADAASRTYLDKSATSLSLAESVLLSAILNAPALNPIDSEGAMRDSYLAEVAKLETVGYLTSENADELRRTNFTIFEPPQLEAEIRINPGLQRALARSFAELKQEEIERGGFQIQSTIHYDLQKRLECLAGLDNIKKEDGRNDFGDCSFAKTELTAGSDSGAVQEWLAANLLSAIVVDVKTGDLLASIDLNTGANDSRIAGKNFSPHQPGSTLTPFIALTAFSERMSPSTLVWDLPEGNYLLPEGYQNPDGTFAGPISLRKAITEDRLGPVTEILHKVGLNTAQDTLTQLGISISDQRPLEELIFRGGAVSADSLAMAYLPFAGEGKIVGGGNAVLPDFIAARSLITPFGETIQLAEEKTISLLDSNLAYLVMHILAEGDQSYRYLNRPAGVKIGRISSEGAAWVVGFTPEVLAAVYVGGNESKHAARSDAEGAALALWSALINTASSGLPIRGWAPPENITRLIVCSPSGKLPTQNCADRVNEVFLAGNEPYQTDEMYVNIPINQESNRLATSYTPFSQIVDRVYLKLPTAAQIWAADNQVAQAPNDYDPIPSVMNTDAIRIYQPENFAYFDRISLQSSDVEVKAELKLDTEIIHVQVALGQGFYPSDWREISSAAGLENGQWTLAILDISGMDPGLYDIRVTAVTRDQRFFRSDHYISIN